MGPLNRTDGANPQRGRGLYFWPLFEMKLRLGQKYNSSIAALLSGYGSEPISEKRIILKYSSMNLKHGMNYFFSIL